MVQWQTNTLLSFLLILHHNVYQLIIKWAEKQFQQDSQDRERRLCNQKSILILFTLHGYRKACQPFFPKIHQKKRSLTLQRQNQRGTLSDLLIWQKYTNVFQQKMGNGQRVIADQKAFGLPRRDTLMFTHNEAVSDW